MNRTVFNPQMSVDATVRTNMDNIQNSIELIMNTIRYDIHLSVRNSMNEISTILIIFVISTGIISII